MGALLFESSKYTDDGLYYDVANTFGLYGNIVPFTTTANTGNLIDVTGNFCPFYVLSERRTSSQRLPVSIDDAGAVSVYDALYDEPFVISQDWNTLDDADTLTIYKNAAYSTGVKAILQSASGASGTSITFSPPSPLPTKWTLTQSGGIQVARYYRGNLSNVIFYDSRNAAPVYKVGLQATIAKWKTLTHRQTYALGDIVDLIGAQWIYCGGLASTSPRNWGGYCNLARNFE